jgi:RimJ/RimL family protein N-acetyltransferase
MLLEIPGGILRPWRADDAASLVRHANNPRVWANLRDRFPSPYTPGDADAWLRHCARTVPITDLAIDVEGEAVGGVGLVLQTDVERVDAEIGYWLGEEYWGRGLMSAAVGAFVPWAFSRFNLARVHANVFAFNAASARVLEKAGFELEGRLRQSAYKNEQLIDQLLYARVRSDWRP